MTDLITRLRAATGPDRGLDAEIAVATFKTIVKDDDLIHARLPASADACALGAYWIKSRSGLSLHTAPEYTASLDAALALVPKGWDWDAGTVEGQPMASVSRPDPNNSKGWFIFNARECKTVALALVAARLKAERASELSAIMEANR